MNQRVKSIISVGVLFIVMSVSRPMVFGQATTGTISGTVSDESGAVLPEAIVTVVHVATGMTRTVMTDENGRYRVPGLPLGDYEVRVEHSGFQAAVQRGLTLTVGEEAVLDFHLRVGQLTEEILVTGTAPQLETTKASISLLVDSRKIRDLPLNGRNWAQLVTLETGVIQFRDITPQTAFPGAGKGLRLSINGARPEFNNFILDGTDVNDAFSNAPGGAAGEFLGIDALREFRALTNTYSAEYGRVAGGVVMATTRSGSNEVHGSVFAFHRNDNLDAKNFFDLPSEPTPEFKRNQFGFTLGGPLIKDRSFAFGSYEGLRERRSTTSVASVPNASARMGIIDGQRVGVDPRIRPYLDLFPLPNVPGSEDVGGGTGLFTFNFLQPTRTDFFVARIDHRFTDSDSLFASYSFADTEVTRTTPLPVYQINDSSRNQFFTLEYQKVLSPQWLNTAHFGFNRSRASSIDEPLVSLDPRRGLLPFIPGKQLGLIRVSGLSLLGPTIFNPTVTVLNMFQFKDDMTVTRGGHSLKWGLEMKRFQVNDFNSLVDNGLWLFFSLRDFLRGAPQAFLGIDPQSDITRHYRQWMFGLYVQDDYRIHPRLTLNLGLRYEWVTVPGDIRGRTANFRHPLTDMQPTIVGGPPTRNPSLKNFAPRIGFAWDVFGDGRTAVRGGFGLFFNPPLYNVYFASFLFNPPFTTFTAQPGILVFFQFPQVSESIFVPNLVNPVEFELNSPYLAQYNLNLQREVAGGIVISAAYIGSRGIHLPRPSELNFNTPEVRPDGSLFFPLKAAPGGVIRNNSHFVSMLLRDTGGNSWYNAFTLSANKRWHEGLQFQVSYTISKSIDDSPPILRDVETSGTVLLNFFAPHLDKSLSNFDKRRRLSVNFTYDLPFGPKKPFLSHLQGAGAKLLGGWQIGGIVALESGTPFTVENGLDRARTGQIGPFRTDRPNLAPGVRRIRILGDPSRWFDPSQFELQPAGFLGTAGRNILIGPGLANVDFILAKTTRVGERLNVEFRTEIFNLFNRPNFATPDNFGRLAFLGTGPQPGADGVPNPAAGRITRTVTTSRQIQFALKISF